MTKTVQFMGEECSIKYERYAENQGKNTHMALWCEEGPMATCTVYLPGLAPEEVAIKDYSENRGMLDALLAANIITKPHRWISSGYVTIPVCYLIEEVE